MKVSLMYSSLTWNYLSYGNYVIEYCISGCDWTQSGKEGSVAREVPSMHIYSCIIKWRAQKTFIYKRHTSEKINLRSARRAIYPQTNRVPALIRFMVDWTMVLLDFMELWVWKLTTVYSHLEVLWQFRCRLWKRGVQWMDKHLWHFLSALCSR